MADILPSSNILTRIAEHESISMTFIPSLGEGETLVSIEITEWDYNDGITVSGDTFFGEYSNTFDYGTDRLLVRKGDVRSHLDSWEDITEPSKTDVYCWKAPTDSRVYSYTVTMHYTVKTEPEGGGGSKSTSQEVLTKTYTQEVYPNWDMYAIKLKENIRIRRLTWLE